MKRRTSIRRDRAAVNALLGLVEDPLAHGRHAVDPQTGRVTCGMRRYKAGYAPCQIVASAATTGHPAGSGSRGPSDDALRRAARAVTASTSRRLLHTPGEL